MQKISLGRDMFALVDDADYPELSKYKWTCHGHRNTFYVTRSENGVPISMHRQILGLDNRKVVCDHKDGNGLNNQRDNLRACTILQNNLNKRTYKNNVQGFKGVKRVSKNRFMARIRHIGKTTYLGTFDCPKEAAHAYNEKAKELHGEFARLNKI